MPPPVPTATPAPAEGWQESGLWYRSTEDEAILESVYRSLTPGVDPKVRSATLDSDINTISHDFAINFSCAYEQPLIRLFPYTFEVPAGIDTYVVAIWDESSRTIVAGTDSQTADTNDEGSALVIWHRLIALEIADLIRFAEDSLTDSQVAFATMWDSDNEDTELWADFDTTGAAEAFEYLACY